MGNPVAPDGQVAAFSVGAVSTQVIYLTSSNSGSLLLVGSGSEFGQPRAAGASSRLIAGMSYLPAKRQRLAVPGDSILKYWRSHKKDSASHSGRV